MANRLEHEDSPYLQQHKDNPVDWYPWCDEAFKRAKDEHKAIFISIGYSSCHWCHVMEHEVFENEEIAKFLNEHLICIKVDREERPDIDKHYQEVHQLLNRRPGGWPTSIFCTPENKPFFAGTYLPPRTQDRRIGFSEIITIIADKISQNDEELFKNADEIQSYLQPSKRPTEASHLSEKMALTFVKQARHNYEPAYGGFSTQPKFPHASTLTTLLNIAIINDDEDIKQMVRHTLKMMQRGGMYDLVEGGFCRYSVDSEWLVPHFEKMTYDNGLLCELYATAGHFLNEPSFITTAREIADFMLTRMSENTLFYSASDADSEGEEGKYFVYSPDEAIPALSNAGFTEESINDILKTLNISRHGNFEGKSIVRLDKENRPDWFPAVMDVLKTIRDKRAYPFIDKKVQVSWNAMMIKALFKLSVTQNNYLQKAVDSLETLMKCMLIDGKLYHSALINKAPKVEAFLEDYAYLGTTLITAYQMTLNETYLINAQQLCNTALEKYFDAGRWFFSEGEFVTEAETSDSSYPGSVGVITDLLLSLGTLIDSRYRRLAFKTIEYYSMQLGKTPIHFPYLFNQTFRYIKEDRIVKSSASNLQDNMPILLRLDYPYIMVQPDSSSDDSLMICGVDSCFAKTNDIHEVNGLINTSFTHS